MAGTGAFGIQWRGHAFSCRGCPKASIEEAYASSQDLNDESWNRYRQQCNQLERFYRTRSAYAELARWQESEWRRNRFRINSPGDLLEIADSYKYSNLASDEIRVLKEYIELPGLTARREPWLPRDMSKPWQSRP